MQAVTMGEGPSAFARELFARRTRLHRLPLLPWFWAWQMGASPSPKWVTRPHPHWSWGSASEEPALLRDVLAQALSAAAATPLAYPACPEPGRYHAPQLDWLGRSAIGPLE